MVLFNKQGKWFPPITHKPWILAQLRTGLSQSSVGEPSIFLSPTCAYSIGKNQLRSGLSLNSLNTHHTAFAFLVQPNHWNATRTINCNWCFQLQHHRINSTNCLHAVWIPTKKLQTLGMALFPTYLLHDATAKFQTKKVCYSYKKSIYAFIHISVRSTIIKRKCYFCLQ